METKFIEATDTTEFNHGKFMVARFTSDEWDRVSQIDLTVGHLNRLLTRCGWTVHHFLVMDLQTGEGGIFYQGGNAVADLEKHRIWVCPMFQPFLEWLYGQEISDLNSLPSLVNVGNVPTAMAGYRRPGP